MQTPKKTVKAAAASMPTQKKSTTGAIPKTKTPVNSTAITPKVKTDKAPASTNPFNTRELEGTKQRIIQQMNNDRLLQKAKQEKIIQQMNNDKRQKAQQDAERAQSQYNQAKYQVRDSSMPLAPTQFNDM